jgi:hypothetical protein
VIEVRKPGTGMVMGWWWWSERQVATGTAGSGVGGLISLHTVIQR